MDNKSRNKELLQIRILGEYIPPRSNFNELGLLALYVLREEWMTRPVPAALSKSELREAVYAANGLSALEAAGHTGFSTGITRTIRNNIIAKTASPNMAAASFKLIANGFLDFPRNEYGAIKLSARQTVLADMICQGYKNFEITDILGKSPDTITTRINRLLAKLEAHNRTNIPKRMFETGNYMFVSPGVVIR